MAKRGRRRKRGSGGRVDIGQEIDRLVRKLVPRDEIRLTRIRTVWPRVATPRVARRTWPARFRGHRLVVYVHDNQWLHELSYLRQAMTERLREIERLGPAPSTDADPDLVLEFRIGRIPPEVLIEPPPPPPPRGPPLPLNPPPETLEAMHRIRDPELREAIAAARYLLGGGAQ